VELQGVAVRYQDATALSGIDLAIEQGEFFSLLGPSGCGKTTTLNIIGGFARLDEGRLLINGQPMQGTPPHRRPVNTVFQSYALFPHMTIAENVAFGPRMAGAPPAEIARRVADALALVSLAGFGDRRPSQLSGGQQQRVALARALVNRPSVLLLDEPLGALDLKLRRQMQLELTKIQREVGITFVYVTHDQEEAMTMSDRIAVMNRGAVVQVGTPQEIYERPASLFVADFIGSSNILPGRVTARDGGLGAVELADGSLVRVPMPDGVAAGADVRLVVRPDHMRIGGAGDNSLTGTVVKVSYLGTHRQVTVRLGSGAEVAVTQGLSADQGTAEAAEVGSTVEVTWPAFRSLCFATVEGQGTA
jgi:spermidine/putrescine transport system ATP-binding protein